MFDNDINVPNKTDFISWETAMDDWISMRDKKPDKISGLLVYGPLMGITAAHYNDNSGEFYCKTFNITEYVTHWMPLPNPPEEV